MKKFILFFFVCIISFACGISKNISEADFSTFKNKIKENKIEIEFEWAQPMGLGNVQGIDRLFINGSNQNNINLIGNTNFFRIKNDSLQIELPYYGTHQISAPTPGTNIGISFDGIPKNKSTVFKEDKNKAILKYDVTTDNDTYNMTLTLYPNNNSNLSVTSDRKTAISYSGNWRVLK